MRKWSILKRMSPGPDRDKNRFQDRPGFQMVWEQKTLPGPGAMNYAYESLALAPQSPISGAVNNRQQLRPTAIPNYKFQDGYMIGVPMVAGQMVMQPLYDPNMGYTRPRVQDPSVMPPNAVI